MRALIYVLRFLLYYVGFIALILAALTSSLVAFGWLALFSLTTVGLADYLKRYTSKEDYE